MLISHREFPPARKHEEHEEKVKKGEIIFSGFPWLFFSGPFGLG